MPSPQDILALRRRMQRRHHPRRGASIKVEPIRERAMIERIKSLLSGHPRNLCLFTLGINTAYRASELLSLKVGDVADLKVGDSLEIKQRKTGKYRRASLNTSAFTALTQCLGAHPAGETPGAPLFLSRKTKEAISVPTLNHLVKSWCREAGLTGNYGSHTLRKTWGYQQRVWKNADLKLLVRAYGHSCEAQTLEYLCIQPSEIQDLYLNMEL